MPPKKDACPVNTKGCPDMVEMKTIVKGVLSVGKLLLIPAGLGVIHMIMFWGHLIYQYTDQSEAAAQTEEVQDVRD